MSAYRPHGVRAAWAVVLAGVHSGSAERGVPVAVPQRPVGRRPLAPPHGVGWICQRLRPRRPLGRSARTGPASAWPEAAGRIGRLVRWCRRLRVDGDSGSGELGCSTRRSVAHHTSRLRSRLRSLQRRGVSGGAVVRLVVQTRFAPGRLVAQTPQTLQCHDGGLRYILSATRNADVICDVAWRLRTRIPRFRSRP